MQMNHELDTVVSMHVYSFTIFGVDTLSLVRVRESKCWAQRIQCTYQWTNSVLKMAQGAYEWAQCLLNQLRLLLGSGVHVVTAAGGWSSFSVGVGIGVAATAATTGAATATTTTSPAPATTAASGGVSGCSGGTSIGDIGVRLWGVAGDLVVVELGSHLSHVVGSGFGL
eukprot:GFYU01003000.1.p1 GENE.GFYU01003000.1~~GFYU01003000.1.p1  ORF type:complete len:169 (-),score=22.38 GFYU01003000.1:30-536(-)